MLSLRGGQMTCHAHASRQGETAADSVIEAVGAEAHGSLAGPVLQAVKLQPDRLIALHPARVSG